jgi:hypothetical protein
VGGGVDNYIESFNKMLGFDFYYGIDNSNVQNVKKIKNSDRFTHTGDLGFGFIKRSEDNRIVAVTHISNLKGYNHLLLIFKDGILQEYGESSIIIDYNHVTIQQYTVDNSYIVMFPKEIFVIQY